MYFLRYQMFNATYMPLTIVQDREKKRIIKQFKRFLHVC